MCRTQQPEGELMALTVREMTQMADALFVAQATSLSSACIQAQSMLPLVGGAALVLEAYANASQQQFQGMKVLTNIDTLLRDEAALKDLYQTCGTGVPSEVVNFFKFVLLAKIVYLSTFLDLEVA